MQNQNNLEIGKERYDGNVTISIATFSDAIRKI